MTTRTSPRLVGRGRHGLSTSAGPPRRAGAARAASREVSAGAQLGDRHVHRANPGVEVRVPVTVPDAGPLRAAGPVLGAAERVRLGASQDVDEDAQQLVQQDRVGAAKALVRVAGSLDTGASGHLSLFSRVDLEGLSKNHAVTAHTSTTTPRSRPGSHTSLRDATSSCRLRPRRPISPTPLTHQERCDEHQNPPDDTGFTFGRR